MRTADQFVKELERAIAGHERELTRLRNMLSAATGDVVTDSDKSAEWPKPAKSTRRRRRTKDEMEAIDRRITELHEAAPRRKAADIWRQLINEGLLEEYSSDRDTVSKKIRELQGVPTLKDAIEEAL